MWRGRSAVCRQIHSHRNTTPFRGRGPGVMENRSVYYDVWIRDLYENHFKELFSHAMFGYSLRVAALGLTTFVTFMTGRRLLYWSEENTPVAQRRFQRQVEVTFIDRTREANSDIWIYRFALPNSFDCTGHDAFSSVSLDLQDSFYNSTKRFYTPINHPEQRGIVEFAIKHYNPGEMSHYLMAMSPGESIWMGGWLKEFRYKPNEFDDIGFIAGASGITPFLQLLTMALADPDDKTSFSLLYANDAPDTIPFKQKLLTVQERFPERVKVNFVVQRGVRSSQNVKLERGSQALAELGRPLSSLTSVPTSATQALFSVGNSDTNSVMVYDDSVEPECRAVKSTMRGYDGYLGFVDRDLILETMPLPKEPRSKVFVCTNAKMLSNLCGRSVPVWRWTYWQGVQDGIMKQMGYYKNQIYKFSYSWHYLGYDT